MSQTIPPEEVEWIAECYAAGDTVEEIAADGGYQRDEVVAALGNRTVRLSALQRTVLQLYSAGVSLRDIDRQRGNFRNPGAAAGMVLTDIRRKGLRVPYRRQDLTTRHA